MKFFISYSRSMKQDVHEVIRLLRASGHEVWWDGDIPTIEDWWATILKNIEWCEIFIFMISEKAVASEYCMAELRYGIARNRPVLPFILDDHTRYSIPTEFGRRQWFVHNGDVARMLAQIIQDSQKLDLSKHKDTYAPRPPEPNTGAGTLTKQFQQAVSLAENGHLEEAIKRFRNVASLHPDEWGEACQQWVQRLQLYMDIADLADHKATLKRAHVKWEAYLKQYDADFDPINVVEKLAQHITELPSVVVITSSKPDVKTILPAPFDWIEIPAGNVTLVENYDDKSYFGEKGESKVFSVPAFAIAKYPVTTAQFAKFIAAKGYEQQKWWTEAGWQQKEAEKWTGPHLGAWVSSDLHPIVGVSWYEAIAFCLWLRHETGDAIMLPTEQQWQRAAQALPDGGDSGFTYTWGNVWDCQRCNNRVGLCNSDATSPVTAYSGKTKGDSPCGVVDMTGNVREWCKTAYYTGSDDIIGTDVRVLRGGSWDINNSDELRTDYRDKNRPHGRSVNRGFRLARSYS